MTKFKSKVVLSIRTKLTLLLIAIALCPLLVLNWMSLLAAEHALKNSTLSGLNMSAEYKAGEVYLYLETLKTNARDFSSDGFIKRSLEKLSEHRHSLTSRCLFPTTPYHALPCASMAPQDTTDRDVGSVDSAGAQYRPVRPEHSRSLTSMSPRDTVRPEHNSILDSLIRHLVDNKLPIQNDLLFIDVLDDRGNIIASTRSRRIGMAQSNRNYYQKGLEGIYVSGVDYNTEGQLSGAIAVPLTKADDPSETIGVLVNHYRMDKLKDLFSGRLVSTLGGRDIYRNLSQSESVFLVNLQGYMITGSSGEMKTEARTKIDTYPVQQAEQFNKETNGIWENHIGIPVAGVSVIIAIDDFKYLLVAEKELTAAFKHIQNLKTNSYMLLLMTIVAIFIVSWLIAYFITIPLHKLMSCIDVISSGKFDIDIKCIRSIKSRDELGLLAMKFYNMTLSIKAIRDELVNKNSRLYELSIRDEMTGLYNHRHLIERGEFCVAEANRYGKSLSCIMIDIDHFKPINDNFGHPFGDFVLTGVARLLETQLRRSDIISRYGGEEFAIIMPETNTAEATIVAEKIRQKVAMHLFCHDGIKHQVTISIGVAEYHNYESKVMEVIARADKALYQSKENGRNRVSISAPETYQLAAAPD